jgi:hypothetical protein
VYATNIRLDGTIECDGATPRDSLAGGGAGGSIYIEASNLTGYGTVTAKGGDGGKRLISTIGHGGGGGGGRIVLHYDGMDEFYGSFEAQGGKGYQDGSAGTVFLKASNSNGALYVANDGSNSLLHTGKYLRVYKPFYHFDVYTNVCASIVDSY